MVFHGIFFQILRASSQNSTVDRGKIVQIPRLIMAVRMCVN